VFANFDIFKHNYSKNNENLALENHKSIS